MFGSTKSQKVNVDEELQTGLKDNAYSHCMRGHATLSWLVLFHKLCSGKSKQVLHSSINEHW